MISGGVSGDARSGGGQPSSEAGTDTDTHNDKDESKGGDSAWGGTKPWDSDSSQESKIRCYRS